MSGLALFWDIFIGFVVTLSKIPVVELILAVAMALVMAALGVNIALKKKEDIFVSCE